VSKPDRNEEAFKRRVAVEFRRALADARGKKLSVEEFARTLGITRAGVYKILAGTTIPSLRVLRNARKYWRVHLEYGELSDTYIQAKRTDPRQMEIQFSVSDISKDQIEVAKFSAKEENSLELVIKIDFSKIA
jgi:transcriptional regulator with XRE-family HTH domain